ncbi:MAG: SH3 domain-containing protein [Firmicutes bacterium]|nr:SH3 domain-containing protein [Bacillota bacterium]
MGNLKHTIAALAAVSLVSTLAAVQMMNLDSVRADKLAQKIETVDELPVLVGDGEGETVDFNVPSSSPLKQNYAGQDAYILTSGGSINLRAAADTESTILDVLQVGTKVSILDVDDGWFKVKSGEFTGYIKSEFVSLDYDRVKEVMLGTSMYQNGTVSYESINVRCKADETSPILAQVAEGERVIILETTDNGWQKIYFGENYDIGYVSAQYIEVGDMVSRKDVAKARNERIAQIAKDANIKTAASAVEVKLIPSDDGEVITTLADNAKCRIISGGTKWTKIIVSATNEIGYVRTDNVAQVVEKKEPVKIAETKKTEKKSAETKTAADTKQSKTASIAQSAPKSSDGSSLVAQASKYIGTKYVYGGSSPSGFDCSGLVQYCCKNLGVSVSRSSKGQYSNGMAVSKSDLQPGDLVFFSRGGSISHVAIYAGNGQVIHAPRSGKTVCYQSLSTLCSSSKYVGARRVL